MIDIHCHILPGIDDGARNLDEAVAMLELAHEDGIRAIVATPHRYNDETEPALDAAHRLRDEVSRAATVPVELRVGQEIAGHPSVAEKLGRGALLATEGTRYVLIEPPFTLYPPWMDELFFELQLRGYAPIIAHPERCAEIQQHPEILARLVERGVVSQLTAGSLLGHFGGAARRTAELLIERNLAHVLATDAHSAEGRRVPSLRAARDAVTRLAGAARAEAMVETVPRAIWDGERLPPLPPASPARRRRFALF